jgi:dTDP-4-dehydrorhamnose reductase
MCRWCTFPRTTFSTASPTQPYGVDSPTRPLGVYGASKLAGELAVRTLCPRHWILRTSWVFSEHGANFVKTILRLAAGPGPLRVVADQRGTPTYAGHLAALVAAMDVTADTPRLAYGTYHATGGPAVSWHGFAERIVAEASALGMIPAGVPVQAITTAEYPTAARRPANSVLAPSAAIDEQGLAGFDWRVGLKAALAALSTPAARNAGEASGNA